MVEVSMSTQLEEGDSRGPFRDGGLALLIDRKGRRYLLHLREDGAFHTHMGYLEHKAIIGRDPGEWFQTNSGHRFLALKPTLSDYILEMKRATQVIYPKDVGAILMLGDIFPGARVVEGGFGSGALTMALLRTVGPEGSVTSYEIRPGQAEKSMNRIRPLMPDGAIFNVREADIYEGIEEREVDRLVLDLPEPWRVVSHAAEALALGGIILSFLPTTLQVHRLTLELQQHGSFQLVETVELMLRPWHVSERSMRPDHRMVAHTGFITTARRCSPRPGTSSIKSSEKGRDNDG